MNLKNEFENLIPPNYKSAIEIASNLAEKSGVKIYLIGGIVRDLFLQNPIKDVDITVQGDAVEFCKQLEAQTDCKIITIQENLRTAKVEFVNSQKAENAIIDFASTREEYYSKGGSLPIAQNFGCELEKDIKRRDFTINTLAIALIGNEKFSVIDYSGGLDDLKNKKIRILHEKSFIDDPSRIVRAIKFQMRLDFDIEQKTQNLMENYLNNVDPSIPLERIKNELFEYFSIPQNDIYENLIKKKVFRLITDTPPMNINKSRFDEMSSFFNEEKAPIILFLMLLINSENIPPHLNLTSNELKTIEEVKELLKLPPFDFNDNFTIYNNFINKTELSPVIYYITTGDKSVIKFYKQLKKIKILINGNDLINLGFKPSSFFSEIFQKVLKEKLNGKLKSKQDELEFCRQLYKF